MQMKKLGLVLLGLLLLAILWFGYEKYQAKTAVVTDTVIVEAKRVTQGNITVEAKAVGTLIAAKFVQITPETAGQVEKIHWQDGSIVKQGDVIIGLDDKVLRAKAASAKANLFLSETNYKRMKLLGKQGAISQQAIDEAQADVNDKKAIAEENLVSLEKMQLTAPFAGVLGKLKVNPGEHVNVGQELVSLTDTEHLRVEYAVSEKFLSLIKLGQKIKVLTSAYPGKVFTGVVTYISATIDRDDRTIDLYADVTNEDRLLTAGLFVNVTHQLGEEKNVILVPAQSLVPTIDGHEVFRISNNKVTAVPVIIGQRTGNNVQVQSGLSAKDIIVTAGQQKLKDGMIVKIKANATI